MQKDKILNEVRLRILSQELEAGRALSEEGLADEYGVSRTPIRDVLLTLEREGLVVSVPNRGASVAYRDLSMLRAYFEIAEVMMPKAAALAAERRSEAQLAAMKRAHAEFDADTEAAISRRRVDAYRGFVAALAAACGNDLMARTVVAAEDMYIFLAAGIYKSSGGTLSRPRNEAREFMETLTDAVAAQDATVAAEITTSHLATARQMLLERMM